MRLLQLCRRWYNRSGNVAQLQLIANFHRLAAPKHYATTRQSLQSEPNTGSFGVMLRSNERILALLLTFLSAVWRAFVSAYDRRGNVIRRANEAGSTFTSGFDGLDRVKTTAGPVENFVSPQGAPVVC